MIFSQFYLSKISFIIKIIILHSQVWSCYDHPSVIQPNHSNKRYGDYLSLLFGATHVLSLQFPYCICNYGIPASLSPQVHVKSGDSLQHHLVCIRVDVDEKQNYLVQYGKCDNAHEDGKWKRWQFPQWIHVPRNVCLATLPCIKQKPDPHRQLPWQVDCNQKRVKDWQPPHANVSLTCHLFGVLDFCKIVFKIFFDHFEFLLLLRFLSGTSTPAFFNSSRMWSANGVSEYFLFFVGMLSKNSSKEQSFQ